MSKYEIPELNVTQSLHERLVRIMNARKPDECYGRIFGGIDPKPVADEAYIWPKHLTRATPTHVEPLELDSEAVVAYSKARGDRMILGCVHFHPNMSAFLSSEDKGNIQALLRGMRSAYKTAPFPIYNNTQEVEWIKEPIIDDSNLEKIIIKDKRGFGKISIRALPRLRAKLLELKPLLEEDQCINMSIDVAAPRIYYMYSLVIGEREIYAEAVALEQSCDVHKGIIETPPTKIKVNLI